MVELTHRNTRRYGGYLVHMGIVLMFIGFTGAAFNQNETVEVQAGRHGADRQLRAEGSRISAKATTRTIRGSSAVIVDVSKNGAVISARWSRSGGSTRLSRQPTAEVGIRRRLNEDLYFNFAGMSRTTARP